MTQFVVDRKELEQLVAEAVQASKTGSVDVSNHHRASRARSFRRAVIRSWMDSQGMMVSVGTDGFHLV